MYGCACQLRVRHLPDTAHGEISADASIQPVRFHGSGVYEQHGPGNVEIGDVVRTADDELERSDVYRRTVAIDGYGFSAWRDEVAAWRVASGRNFQQVSRTAPRSNRRECRIESLEGQVDRACRRVSVGAVAVDVIGSRGGKFGVAGRRDDSGSSGRD